MPLQGDQRALLQLLVERGQSYEDIAGLLGTTEEGVRTKARAALSELGGADPDAEVGLTDYLLGQADPIGRADAVRFLQGDPESLELARRIEEELLEIAPGASLPKLPEPRGKRRRAAVPAAGEASEAPPRTGDADRLEAHSASGADGERRSTKQTRLFALIGGVGVILLLVILAITGTFSGDDSDSTATTASTGAADDGTPVAGDETRRLTKVDLTATDGSGVAGTAEFGIVDNTQPYVDLVVNGLDPKPAEDSTYFMWLMIGDQGGYPLPSPLTPDQNGRFSGRIAISPTVTASVATRADTVKISLSPVKELGEAAKDAADSGVPIVSFTGTELASGKIPVVAPDG